MGKLDIEDDDNEGGALARFNAKVAELEKEEEEGKDPTSDDEPRVVSERDENGNEVVAITRAEKKQRRPGLMQELESERQRRAELEIRIARMEGAQSAMLAQQNVVDKTDEISPEEREFRRLQDEHNAAYRELAAKGQAATQADKDAYVEKTRKIEFQKAKLAARAQMAESGVSGNSSAEAITALLAAENPDVYANPRALKYAEAYYQMQRQVGKPDNKETFEASMRAAREAFGLAPKSAPPSESQKSRLSGTPRGGRANAAPAADADDRIVMTKPMRSMARARFPGLPDEEAYVKWAKSVGPSFLKSMREQG